MQECAEAALEYFDAETLSVLPEPIRRPFFKFKAGDRVSQIFRRLRIEERSGYIFDYRFDSTAGAVGDGGSARGRDFKRRHAEIFLSGK
jgi:hypothetical protein